jgi:LysM repeat protein
MNRLRALARPFLLVIAFGGAAFAQQPASPKQAVNLDPLKEAIEKQGRQIEALTQQIAELNRHLAAQKEGTKEAAPGEPAPPPPPDITPPPAAAEVPKAEPVAQPAGIKHTVAKGETLTSIAKRYNIPLAELEKANKIENDRKLQIGQVLNLPATTTKTPEPQTEAKENP